MLSWILNARKRNWKLVLSFELLGCPTQFLDCGSFWFGLFAITVVWWGFGRLSGMWSVVAAESIAIRIAGVRSDYSR